MCCDYITFTWHRLINGGSLFARHDYKGESKRRKELVLAAVIAAFVAVDASRLLAVFLLPPRTALFQPSEIWRFEAGEENLSPLTPQKASAQSSLARYREGGREEGREARGEAARLEVGATKAEEVQNRRGLKMETFGDRDKRPKDGRK